MQIKQAILAATIGLAVPMSAQATTLSLTVTADNAYALYLSTDNATMGTLIPGSDTYGGPAGQWSTATTYTIDLTESVYYLHVIGSNYTPENGLWGSAGTTDGNGGNPNAFLGHFSISGGGYTFANSSTSLDTDATHWFGIAVSDNTSWTTPVNLVQSFGPNGTAPWGLIAGIPVSAEWIWSDPDNAAYADLSTKIMNVNSADLITPLPAALPLFASGLGAIGLLGWRRKRKNARATI
jgi:hypothetical protein